MVYGGARYSRGTTDIEGFVDSNYVGFLDLRKSLIRFVFTAFSTAFSWKASLQKVLALSTTEAEYMALTKAMKESLWLEGIAKRPKIQDKVIVVHYDNQSVIDLSKKFVYHERK